MIACDRHAFRRCDGCQQDTVGDRASVRADDQLILAGKFLDLLTLLHLVFRIQVDQVLHLTGKFRVKLRAGTLDKFLTHLLLRNRVTVASFGGHRVVGVRSGNDPRRFGNIRTLQVMRIALPGTIDSFLPDGTHITSEDQSSHQGRNRCRQWLVHGHYERKGSRLCIADEKSVAHLMHCPLCGVA